MRDFLNGILSFIVASSLTDEEFALCESEIPIYDQASYDDLSRVLATREAVSTMQARLLAYYTARGVQLTAATTARSNIYLGDVLE